MGMIGPSLGYPGGRLTLIGRLYGVLDVPTEVRYE